MPLTLSSPAFEHGQPIPQRYTCEGNDISPPLEWADIPAGTKSLALLVEDPDAPDPARPKRVWVTTCRLVLRACQREPAEKTCPRAATRA